MDCYSWKQRVTRTENDIAKAVDRFLSGVTKIGDVFWLLLFQMFQLLKKLIWSLDEFVQSALSSSILQKRRKILCQTIKV